MSASPGDNAARRTSTSSSFPSATRPASGSSCARIRTTSRRPPTTGRSSSTTRTGRTCCRRSREPVARHAGHRPPADGAGGGRRRGLRVPALALHGGSGAAGGVMAGDAVLRGHRRRLHGGGDRAPAEVRRVPRPSQLRAFRRARRAPPVHRGRRPRLERDGARPGPPALRELRAGLPPPGRPLRGLPAAAGMGRTPVRRPGGGGVRARGAGGNAARDLHAVGARPPQGDLARAGAVGLGDQRDLLGARPGPERGLCDVVGLGSAPADRDPRLPGRRVRPGPRPRSPRRPSPRARPGHGGPASRG